ncbi:stalk domain-containing protein [Paenibacillus sp. FSL L8-0506]|uniref:stalk domain-containing protein n=1 Tax=Paenibacillus sp. FSL L8-0506 TaxID=2975335 RepID=UPI0030FBEF46
MKKIPTFMLGLVVGITLTAGSAVGAATYLKATQSNVSLVVNGQKTSLTDKPVNVNGKLYLPVRDTAKVLGYEVNSVTSSSVSLVESNAASNSNTATSNSNSSTNNKTGDYVDNLHELYSTDGKLDAEKVKTGIASGKLTVNSQDKETKNSLLHYTVLEDNFAVYSVIKVNALNTNLQNSEGKTSLHLAVIIQNDFYFGELITAYRADAKIKDNSGKLPIDYATKGTSTYNGLQGYMM